MRTDRRMVRVLASLVVVLALSEVAVRGVEDRLPARLDFHSAEGDIKLAQMDRLQTEGGVDIVLTGSSLVTAGLLPDVIEDRLDGQKVYNAGLAAGVPMLLEPWLDEIVMPRLTPDVVVIGLSSFDLSDSDAAFEFRAAFDDSPGGKKATGKLGILDRLNGWLSDRSALWGHRTSLRDPTMWKGVLAGGPLVDSYTAAIGADGANRPPGDFRFETRQSDNGPRIEDWSLGAENGAALLRMIDAVFAAGAQPILVSMPVTSYFIERHPEGTRSYTAFRRELKRIADDTGTSFLDYESPEIDYFADVVHLNSWGADAFSKVVAADVSRVAAEILDGDLDGGHGAVREPTDPLGSTVTTATPSSIPGGSPQTSVPVTVTDPDAGVNVSEPPEPSETSPPPPPLTLPTITLPPLPEPPPLEPPTEVEPPDVP